MAQESILDYNKLEVRKKEKADDDIVGLLENTVLGSEGGMRYSMQNIRERIINYGDGLSFLALYKRDSLTGAIGLCRRRTINCGVEHDSTYLRYLAVRSAFQATAAPGRHRERLLHAGESFKHKIFSIFNQPFNDVVGAEPNPAPHIRYAYVESRNERSKNLIYQAGFEYIRSFLTIAFSRFNPSVKTDVSRLSPEEEPEMSGILADYYKKYCFYSDEFSFFDHGYYVLRKKNTIVAGVCAIPTMYQVVNIPGVWGWILMKIMPNLPYFRRLFRPGEFKYLVLTSIYCREGNEHLLPDLFESVCASKGYNTALTWLDDHSELYESLRTNRRMGTLNRILNAKPGLVYASFSNVDQEEREKFYECPAYISGFDFS